MRLSSLLCVLPGFVEMDTYRIQNVNRNPDIICLEIKVQLKMYGNSKGSNSNMFHPLKKDIGGDSNLRVFLIIF